MDRHDSGVIRVLSHYRLLCEDHTASREIKGRPAIVFEQDGEPFARRHPRTIHCVFFQADPKVAYRLVGDSGVAGDSAVGAIRAY
jgi:hypothetical protein